MDAGEKDLIRNAVLRARQNAEIAANALTTARQRLELHNHDSKCLSAKMWQLLHKAFLLANEPTTQEMTARIKSIEKTMETTRQGLRQRLEIVDLPQSDFRANLLRYETWARQRQHANGPYPPNVAIPAPRSLRPTGLFGYVRGAFPAIAGRIHIAFGYLFDEDLSTWTVIHEATHKFAGTADKAYWDDVHNLWETPLTVSKAIKNADSYAMFAMEYQGAFLWG